MSQPWQRSRAIPFSITTSAGVGIYPVHGEERGHTDKSRDLGLYEAKRAGKNAYRISNVQTCRRSRAVRVARPHSARRCRMRRRK